MSGRNAEDESALLQSLSNVVHLETHEKYYHFWANELTSSSIHPQKIFQLHILMYVPHLCVSISDSRAYIQDDRDLHVEKGSRLSLSCSILEPSAPPDYVLWYHDGKVLNYSPTVNIRTDTSQVTSSGSSSLPSETSGTFEARPRADMKRQRLKDTNEAGGGVDDDEHADAEKRDVDGHSRHGDSNEPQMSVMDTNKANEKTHHNNGGGGVVSKLSIDNVRRVLHSGNYTCEPSNARAASITVHIVDGKWFWTKECPVSLSFFLSLFLSFYRVYYDRCTISRGSKHLCEGRTNRPSSLFAGGCQG